MLISISMGRFDGSHLKYKMLTKRKRSWKFYPKLSLDEIENEIISDGVRRLSPLHQRPSGRRRSLSAEDNTSYWNRVFSSRDSEEIDSSEAQERFNKFVKKKWCYGKDPAKKGVIDQIEHSVAITVSKIIEIAPLVGSKWTVLKNKRSRETGPSVLQ